MAKNFGLKPRRNRRTSSTRAPDFGSQAYGARYRIGREGSLWGSLFVTSTRPPHE